MKCFVIFLAFIFPTAVTMPHAFGLEQNLFDGTSSFERVPDTIMPGTTYDFEITFRYTESQYWLHNIHPKIEISPEGVAPYVHVDFERISVQPYATARTPATIRVDPGITYEKIFLTVSFVAENSSGDQLRSYWSDALFLKIVNPKNNPCFSEELNQPAPCSPETSMEFYEFMGQTWMESKKQEMLDAFQSDEFHEWIDQTENHYHWNVYQYYSYTEDLTKFLRHSSPLKQHSSGIEYGKIHCNGNMVLIQKYDGAPACVKPESKQKLVEREWATHIETEMISWKKYVTLSTARVDLSSAYSQPVYRLDSVMSNSILYKSLVGADGCKDGTEVCAMSNGITLDRHYPFGISVTDNDDYSMTLNYAQAADLLSDLDWAADGDYAYTVIEWNEKRYLLILSTSDHAKIPDIAMSLVGTVRTPVPLGRGSVLAYPIQVGTWATYGDSAQVDLAAALDARDSGIDVWVEPARLTIPERSSATATLFIQAQDDARDGVYDIRVTGRANGNNAGLHCGNAVCPAVVIGDSDWTIRTFGTGSGMGIGLGDVPDHTWAEIGLNKKMFFENDTAEIRAYLVNNGTKPMTLDSEMNLLIKVIKAEPNGYYDHFYGIHAVKESGKPVVLEPKSKTLLARPFHWNQETFSDFSDVQRLEPGMRLITADITSGNRTWNSEAWVEIK